MEIHQIRYVVAVAQTGNFSRAAEKCNVSQPSLSQQIIKLEDELGERLFDRMKRSTKPTAAGEMFLQRAVRILEEVEHAKRDAADSREMLRGVLTIGVLPTIAPYLLPDALIQFTEKFPGVEVVVQEDTTSRILKLALSYDVDLVLASRPIDDPRLEILELFSEELVLAVPAGHPLALKRTVTTADLEKERLIVMKEGHCLGDQVLRFCDRRELRPNISFRSSQLETIQSLVRAGMGISLIPMMARQPESLSSPVYRRLQAPRPQREIVAVWPKQRPLVRAACEFLKMIDAGKQR